MFNFTSFKILIIIIIYKYIFLSILALLMVGGGESDNGRKGEGNLGWWNLQGVKMQKKRQKYGKQMKEWISTFQMFSRYKASLKLKGLKNTPFYLTSSTFMQVWII